VTCFCNEPQVYSTVKIYGDFGHLTCNQDHQPDVAVMLAVVAQVTSPDVAIIQCHSFHMLCYLRYFMDMKCWEDMCL